MGQKGQVSNFSRRKFDPFYPQVDQQSSALLVEGSGDEINAEFPSHSDQFLVSGFI
jgi:hypothetical protein